MRSPPGTVPSRCPRRPADPLIVAELRFYRTRANLSQKDLAALVHVSNDVISKIETGERPPAEDFPPGPMRYPSWTRQAL